MPESTAIVLADYVITRWMEDPDPADLQTHVDDVLQHEGSHVPAVDLWAAVARLMAEELIETAVLAAAN